jgi:hypothetical protein
MKTFNVYRHPLRGIEAVKVGFSWPAFFFGFLWLVGKRLWKLAGIWLFVNFVLVVVEAVNNSADPSLAQAMVYLLLATGYFYIWLVPAFAGNKWREGNLIKRGFELVRTTRAGTPDAAIALAVGQA